MIVLVGCASLPQPAPGHAQQVAGIDPGPDLPARLVELAADALLQGQGCLVLGCEEQAATVPRAARFLRHACRTTAVDHLVVDVSPFRLAVVAHVAAALHGGTGVPPVPAAVVLTHLVESSAAVVAGRSVRRLRLPAPSLRQRLVPPPRGSFYVVEHIGASPPVLRTAGVSEALMRLEDRGRGHTFVTKARRWPEPDGPTAGPSGGTLVEIDPDPTWTRWWGSDAACEVVRVRAEPRSLARAAREVIARAWGCYWCGGRSAGGVVCRACGASKRPVDAPDDAAVPVPRRVPGGAP